MPLLMTYGPNFGVTIDGGIARQVVNKSGGTLAKGNCLESDATTSNGVKLTTIGSIQCIGFVYEGLDGNVATIANNATFWMVYIGRADVLVDSGTAIAAGDWLRCSSANAGQATSDTIPSTTAHVAEIGHAMEACDAETDFLVKIQIHFL